MTKNELTYAQLLYAFHPRPIHNEEQYEKTQARIDELLDKVELTDDESDYLSVLGMMIERYEDDNEEDYTLTGFELLKASIMHRWYNFQYRIGA
jgi:HTH-type transcriptional regulator/antitoxin HigA